MSLNSTKKKKLCLQCMECCKVFYVTTTWERYEEKEFYELRGCEVRPYKGYYIVIVPLPCPHLTPQGCDIYNKRPQVCRDYDGRKDPFMKDKCLWNEEVRRKRNEHKS